MLTSILNKNLFNSNFGAKFGLVQKVESKKQKDNFDYPESLLQLGYFSPLATHSLTHKL